jgi:hypothetical protein
LQPSPVCSFHRTPAERHAPSERGHEKRICYASHKSSLLCWSEAHPRWREL